MRALTCEATLVSLVIEDIFQDKADERTVNLLRLLAGRSEGVVWKEISLSELKARFAFTAIVLKMRFWLCCRSL